MGFIAIHGSIVAVRICPVIALRRIGTVFLCRFNLLSSGGGVDTGMNTSSGKSSIPWYVIVSSSSGTGVRHCVDEFLISLGVLLMLRIWEGVLRPIVCNGVG